MIDHIVSRGLNVAKTEEAVDAYLSKGQPREEKPSRNVRVIKDVRIFSNTIRQAVDMMQKSGIDAMSVRKEDEDYIEYTIKISKKVV